VGGWVGYGKKEGWLGGRMVGGGRADPQC
jgi:hypothetical protein